MERTVHKSEIIRDNQSVGPNFERLTALMLVRGPEVSLPSQKFLGLSLMTSQSKKGFILPSWKNWITSLVQLN